MPEIDPIDITVRTDTGKQLAHWEGPVVVEDLPGGGIVGAVQHRDGAANYRLEVEGEVRKGNLGDGEGVSIALEDGRAVTIQNS